MYRILSSGRHVEPLALRASVLLFQLVLSGLLTVVQSGSLELVSSIASIALPSRDAMLVSKIGMHWSLNPFTLNVSSDS